jgi:hypothetical protein
MAQKNRRCRDRRFSENGAGEETRTLDVHLGKVVLYQLSYAREREDRSKGCTGFVNRFFHRAATFTKTLIP